MVAHSFGDEGAHPDEPLQIEVEELISKADKMSIEDNKAMLVERMAVGT